MKAASLKQDTTISHLKLVNNTINKNVSNMINEKIYINTLTPNFNFTNHKTELVTPNKCALL